MRHQKHNCFESGSPMTVGLWAIWVPSYSHWPGSAWIGPGTKTLAPPPTHKRIHLIALFGGAACSVLPCAGGGGYQPPKCACNGNKRAMPAPPGPTNTPRLRRNSETPLIKAAVGCPSARVNSRSPGPAPPCPGASYMGACAAAAAFPLRVSRAGSALEAGASTLEGRGKPPQLCLDLSRGAACM